MKNTLKWSKEKVLAEIRAFYKSGRPLNWKIVSKEHRYRNRLIYAGIYYFGSWRKAVEAAGFDYEQMIRKWSKEKIIAEINRLNEAGEWLSCRDVQRSHSALIGAAQRYFGGWGKAVKAAGFPYELIKKMRQKERSLISYRGKMKWSEEKVMTQIRLFYRFKKTLQHKKVAETNEKLIAAGCKYFGSWRKAVEAAGFDYDQFLAKQEWTKEKVISQIQALYKAKKTLKYKEICREGKKLYSAASKRFGSWRKAVAAAGFDYEELFLRKEREEKKEKVISEIKAYYKANGTLQYKKVCKLNQPLVTAASRYFGGWGNAVEAAGFDYDQFLGRQQWTKEKVTSEIQAFYRVKGTLRGKEVRREDKKLHSASVRHFGNWQKALEAAGFDSKQFLDRQQWTREKIIAEIKALYQTKKTLQYSKVYQANKRLCSAASKHFRGWRKAVEAAGFNYHQFLPERKWTKERIISGIQAYYRSKKTLRLRDICREDRFLYSAACVYFGSWRNAVEAAGFGYDQFLPKRKWTKEKVISEIKAYYHTKKTLQSKVVYGDNQKLCSAACKLFGGWRQAVEAAGFEYKQFFRQKEREQRKEEVISEIKAYYKANGTLQYKGVRRSNRSLVNAACVYFGSWRNAVEAAGFGYDQFLPRRKWTKEKVISEIKRYYETRGTLQHEEVCRDNPKLASAANRYFGNWRKALEAAGFDFERFYRQKEREQRRREVISEIKAYYKANGTLQYKGVRRSNPSLVGAAFHYFGSWRKAVETAGFDYDQFLLTHKWTKEEILSGIKAFYKAKGTLQNSLVKQCNRKLNSAAKEHFGSWRNAVEAAGFDYDRFLFVHRWTKEEVISRIQAFYKAEATLMYKEVRRKDDKLYAAACRHFGSWRKAVEAAGFDSKQFPPVHKWTNKKIISGIQTFYRTKKTLRCRDVRRDDSKLFSAASKHFRGWREAVEAAGFDYEQFLPKRRWTKEKVISEIKAYHHTKKTLQYKEVYEDNKKLCSAACKHFGSWRKAVEAAGFDYDQFRGGKR